MYPNNYPSNYSAYQIGSAYEQAPPNSGPPPPPGAYGDYCVNPYGGAAMYAGYSVPAVQQCAQMNQAYTQQAPPPMPMPATTYISQFNDSLATFQQQQQEQMMQMMKGLLAAEKGETAQDDEKPSQPSAEYIPDLPPAVTIPEAGSEDVKLKEMMRQAFINELLRRQRVSGTFELTEGTVKPFKTYASDDPVADWSRSHDDLDLVGKNWDPESDCKYLRAAMKGIGTDEAAITHVTATRSNTQRQELKKMFKTMYGRDLVEDIASELSGDYKESMMACFTSPAFYDAWCIKEAIYGPGTDEQVLIEILMTRTNAQIEELKQVYGDVVSPHRKVSSSKLDDDIKDDCGGDFKRLLISAAQGNRYEVTREQLEGAVEERVSDEGVGTGMFHIDYSKLCDTEAARRDAQRLYKAGEKRWGTDEEEFNLIFSTRHYYQLRAIWDEYVKITQRDILNSVDRETSGDFKAGLKAVVMNIRCRPMYFAERLMKAMKGLGTDDSSLIRLVVSRSEIDMVQIKKCFLELASQTLWNYIEHDCSGNYKKLLEAIVGKN